MGSMSIWHWIIVIAFSFAIIFPFWKLFGRFGIPKALAVLAPVPFVAIIFLWVLAYKKTPA